MARLYLFAEGVTEQTFADMVLKPHLAARKVYLRPPILVSHARRRGRAHRGGGRNYLPMKQDIRRLLAQDKANDASFTTMIDLYAISPSFPRLPDAEKLRVSPAERVEFLERAFAADVDDSRFIPYIQLHQFETYLFCAISLLDLYYDHHSKEIKALESIHEAPEMIDDGPNTAPSKRIIAQISDYKTDKSVVGPLIAERIGLQVIRDKCPHFNVWLTKLESLGHS
jgi:hypothetical protein